MKGRMLRASLLLCIVAAACSAPHVARLPEPLVTPRAAALRAKAAHKEAARELEIDSSSNGDGIVGISAMTSQTTDSYGTKRRRQITRQISHLLSQTAPKLRQKQTKGSAEHHTEYKDAEQQADPCESSPCTDNSHSAALCKHREHGRTCSCQEPGFVYVNDHHGCVDVFVCAKKGLSDDCTNPCIEPPTLEHGSFSIKCSTGEAEKGTTCRGRCQQGTRPSYPAPSAMCTSQGWIIKGSCQAVDSYGNEEGEDEHYHHGGHSDNDNGDQHHQHNHDDDEHDEHDEHDGKGAKKEKEAEGYPGWEERGLYRTVKRTIKQPRGSKQVRRTKHTLQHSKPYPREIDSSRVEDDEDMKEKLDALLAADPKLLLRLIQKSRASRQHREEKEKEHEQEQHVESQPHLEQTRKEPDAGDAGHQLQKEHTDKPLAPEEAQQGTTEYEYEYEEVEVEVDEDGVEVEKKDAQQVSGKEGKDQKRDVPAPDEKEKHKEKEHEEGKQEQQENKDTKPSNPSPAKEQKHGDPPVPEQPTPEQPKPADPAKPVQPAPEPTKPVQPAPEPAKPVQPAPEPAKPVQPAPEPAKPVQPAPEPTKPAQPAPEPAKPAQPAPEPTKPVQPAPEPTKPVQPAPEPAKPVQPAPEPAKPVQPAPAPPTPEQPKAAQPKPELKDQNAGSDKSAAQQEQQQQHAKDEQQQQRPQRPSLKQPAVNKDEGAPAQQQPQPQPQQQQQSKDSPPQDPKPQPPTQADKKEPQPDQKNDLGPTKQEEPKQPQPEKPEEKEVAQSPDGSSSNSTARHGVVIKDAPEQRLPHAEMSVEALDEEDEERRLDMHPRLQQRQQRRRQRREEDDDSEEEEEEEEAENDRAEGQQPQRRRRQQQLKRAATPEDEVSMLIKMLKQRQEEQQEQLLKTKDQLTKHLRSAENILLPTDEGLEQMRLEEEQQKQQDTPAAASSDMQSQLAQGDSHSKQKIDADGDDLKRVDEDQPPAQPADKQQALSDKEQQQPKPVFTGHAEAEAAALHKEPAVEEPASSSSQPAERGTPPTRKVRPSEVGMLKSLLKMGIFTGGGGGGGGSSSPVGIAAVPAGASAAEHSQEAEQDIEQQDALPAEAAANQESEAMPVHTSPSSTDAADADADAADGESREGGVVRRFASELTKQFMGGATADDVSAPSRSWTRSLLGTNFGGLGGLFSPQSSTESSASKPATAVPAAEVAELPDLGELQSLIEQMTPQVVAAHAQEPAGQTRSSSAPGSTLAAVGDPSFESAFTVQSYQPDATTYRGAVQQQQQPQQQQPNVPQSAAGVQSNTQQVRRHKHKKDSQSLEYSSEEQGEETRYNIGQPKKSSSSHAAEKRPADLPQEFVHQLQPDHEQQHQQQFSRQHHEQQQQQHTTHQSHSHEKHVSIPSQQDSPFKDIEEYIPKPKQLQRSWNQHTEQQQQQPQNQASSLLEEAQQILDTVSGLDQQQPPQHHSHHQHQHQHRDEEAMARRPSEEQVMEDGSQQQRFVPRTDHIRFEREERRSRASGGAGGGPALLFVSNTAREKAGSVTVCQLIDGNIGACSISMIPMFKINGKNSYPQPTGLAVQRDDLGRTTVWIVDGTRNPAVICNLVGLDVTNCVEHKFKGYGDGTFEARQIAVSGNVAFALAWDKACVVQCLDAKGLSQCSCILGYEYHGLFPAGLTVSDNKLYVSHNMGAMAGVMACDFGPNGVNECVRNPDLPLNVDGGMVVHDDHLYMSFTDYAAKDASERAGIVVCEDADNIRLDTCRYSNGRLSVMGGILGLAVHDGIMFIPQHVKSQEVAMCSEVTATDVRECRSVHKEDVDQRVAFRSPCAVAVLPLPAGAHMPQPAAPPEEVMSKIDLLKNY